MPAKRAPSLSAQDLERPDGPRIRSLGDPSVHQEAPGGPWADPAPRM